MCDSCGKKKESTKKRTIKVNGVLGYYDKDVMWCDECVDANNLYLLQTWGQE